ncbi:Gfo/Idh/MocA family protein [Brevifollis gellanilyticus]|uniref:Glucose-fructose oxidoreductase n=1 Tax=Brevifollis gellanilyticus TaxID=748831 RepID=A0A512M5Y6_9BACT|nr:Gfo/Idh/MocA family oxidoreductase [Brevifollis gellanilyticus]GEP42145.1 glucose-fructose oxidoreductase [Brevifollis gellanilyticus]
MISPTSRRSFIKIAAPAIIGLNALVRAQSAREGKLGVALCGLGGFSKQSIAPELPTAKNVYFAGAITGDAAKGREWAQQYGFSEKNIFGYADMAKLADNADIQIVHVVTPNSLHAEHSIAAAKAGKHVMCEKPMATNSERCEAMIAAAKAANVLLGVNYRLHWEPHHIKAIEALRNGAVGDLSNGNYEFSWGYANGLADPEKRKNIKQWLLDPKMAGGGAMFDTGVYPVQAACYLTGKVPVSVRGFPTTRHKDFFPEGVEETMSFELLFDDGFQALCRASYSNNFHQCTTLGPKGSVEVLPGLPQGSVYGQSGAGKPNAKRLVINKKEVEAENTLQLATLLDEFAKSITTKTPFKADGAMGLRDIRIVEAIYASAKQGGAKVDVKV